MSSSPPPATFTVTQNDYATLIENLGKTVLPNGKTLSVTLTINGIPFWEIFSTELAYRHLTTAISSTGQLARVKQGVRPYLIRLKHWLKSLHRPRSAEGLRWSAGGTFLFLGFTPRMYRDVLEPVAGRLSAHPNRQVVVLNDSHRPMAAPSANGKCSHQSVWQYWTPEVEDEVRHLKNSLARIEAGLQSSDAFAKVFAGMDADLTAAVRQIFHLLFKGYIPLMLPQAAIARHLINTYRPLMVVSPDTADSRTRIYTFLCREAGIPCLDVQFGLAGDEAIEWHFFAADCVAVWGDSSRRALIKQGVPGDKVHVTGSARHDSLVNPLPHDASSTTLLAAAGSRKIVVLASTYTDSAHGEYTDPGVLREMKLAVFKAAERAPGLLLVVKPHPHEDVNETRALAANYKNVVFAEKSSDIRAAIVICDAFVSFGSTATIDALIADRLTICPIFPGWPFSEIFRESGAVLTPHSENSLMEIFNRIESGNHISDKISLNRAREAYLNDISYHPDGLAAMRIEQLALQMAGLSNK